MGITDGERKHFLLRGKYSIKWVGNCLTDEPVKYHIRRTPLIGSSTLTANRVPGRSRVIAGWSFCASADSLPTTACAELNAWASFFSAPSTLHSRNYGTEITAAAPVLAYLSYRQSEHKSPTAANCASRAGRRPCLRDRHLPVAASGFGVFFAHANS